MYSQKNTTSSASLSFPLFFSPATTTIVQPHPAAFPIPLPAQPAAVAAAYAEVVACQPENARAKHMLATLTGEGEASQGAAHDYVREIFDELSEEFENKLVNHIEYVVPWG